MLIEEEVLERYDELYAFSIIEFSYSFGCLVFIPLGIGQHIIQEKVVRELFLLSQMHGISDTISG